MDTIAIENFLASNPYALSTKRTYKFILELLERETETKSLTPTNLFQFINKDEWNNSRQYVALAACKKYIAWKHGQNHPALNTKIKRIRGKPQRALTAPQVLELLASFDRYKPTGARDLAICSLALDTGLRNSELCRLQQADTDTVRKILQVIVKGGQWETALFSEETAAHIEYWKKFRENLYPKGHLFINVLTGNGLTTGGLREIMENWGKRINVKLSPHDLRRTFAILATENGAPERVLMEGGRWKSSQMISTYTRTLELESMRKYLPISKLKEQEF